MPSTSLLTTSRSFSLNNISDTISRECSFSSLFGIFSSNNYNFNLSVSFLESNASFIKLRFPIKASSMLPLLGHLVIEIDLQNFFMPTTLKALFIVTNPFNYLMLNSLKDSIGA